jgi:photosystem II stability/assembly factor-like uncharacterized protein
MKTFLLIAFILLAHLVPAQWTRITNSPAQANSIYFQSAQTGYILKQDTLFKSADGGNTWHDLHAGFPQYSSLSDIRFLSPDTGFVVLTEGLTFAYPVSVYMTINGGQNWSRLIGPYDGSNIDYHLAGKNDWYFHVTSQWTTASDSIFHTVNGGAGFSKSGNTNAVLYNQAINNLVVYKDSVTSPAQKDLFYKSIDGGATWNLLLTDSTVSAGYVGHQFLNNDGYFLVYQYVTTDNIDSKLYKTTDGGQNWISYNLPSAISAPQAMHFTDANNGYIVSYSSPNQIFKTSDGGQTWNLDFSGANNEYFSGGYGIVEYFGNLYTLGNTIITNHTATSVIDLKNGALNFSLYPNPSTGVISIRSDLSQKETDFMIMDITGRVVHQFSASPHSTGSIDISFLDKGLYLLKHQESSQTILFIKE